MKGLVLAGGKSSRLGQDKTAVPYQGQTLLERTAALLQQQCAQVYISSRNAEMNQSGLPVILDATERIGPIGGIATALSQLGGPLLVLACDLPFMEASLLAALIAARESRPAHCLLTAYEQRESGYIEALVAIYEQEALPLLNQGIANKHYKLSRIIPPHLRHTIVYGPEQEHAFFNVNYPHDLTRLHRSG